MLCLDAHAQGFYNKEKQQAKDITYIIKNFNGPNSRYVAVHNQKNTLEGKTPKVYSGNLTNIKLRNSKSLLNSFQSVFSTVRLKELLKEDGLSTYFYVNPSGKVLEVTFFLNKNSVVTPLELETLEKSIKKNVVFSLNPEQTKGGDFFTLTKRNKYQEILNGTLKWD